MDVGDCLAYLRQHEIPEVQDIARADCRHGSFEALLVDAAIEFDDDYGRVAFCGWVDQRHSGIETHRLAEARQSEICAGQRVPGILRQATLASESDAQWAEPCHNGFAVDSAIFDQRTLPITK